MHWGPYQWLFRPRRRPLGVREGRVGPVARHHAPGELRIRVAGEQIGAAGPDLARLAGLEEVGVLAEIVNDDGTVKRLRSRDGRLTIVNTDASIAKTFEITGLDRVFTIHPTREAAVGSESPATGSAA